ncbi:antirestriction protein [Ralstonia pickettii]|nr:antirestriction protein [Ralstonia pickettii]
MDLISSPQEAATSLIATQVQDGDRLAFLPAMFGMRLMIRGEMLVYAWLGRLSPDYTGGYWNFYRVSNGGYYLAPQTDKPLRISVDGNGFSGEASADAAGIVATLFALSHIVNEGGSGADFDALTSRYYLLRDFAIEHNEARLILAAID